MIVFLRRAFRGEAPSGSRDKSCFFFTEPTFFILFLSYYRKPEKSGKI